jgi:prepilin-type N-terminal cleavage/methylation domain-containing protein
MHLKHQRRRGFTLMELLVVIGVLALLAVIAIPRVIDNYERSRSATQAYSTADISRHIEVFFALNHKYPDGWDSLMADGGAMYSRLSPDLNSPRTLLTTVTITSDQIDSLQGAGISHAFLHDESSTSYSASGTDRRHIDTGSGHDGTPNINTLVAINSTAGSEGLSMLVNDFGLNPNRSASDTTLPRISANTYIVFGIGPKSTLVQSQLQEVPFMEHSNSARSYSRALAVFEVPNTGRNKAKLVGVFGPDGRSKQKAISDYNNPNGPQSH